MFELAEGTGEVNYVQLSSLYHSCHKKNTKSSYFFFSMLLGWKRDFYKISERNPRKHFLSFYNFGKSAR